MVKNKVLLYLDDEKLREKLSLLLEGLFDLKVTPVLGLEGVLNSLDRSQYVANIFSRSSNQDESTTSFIENLKNFGESFEYSLQTGVKSFYADCLERLVDYKISESSYCPISLSRLDAIIDEDGHHPELFVKLNSGRFIKVHPGADRFESERVEEFRGRGVKAFYLTREVFSRVLDKQFSELSDLIKSSTEESAEELPTSALMIHQKLMQSIRDSLMLKLKIPDRILQESSSFLENLIDNGPLQSPWFDRLEGGLDGANYIERLGMLTAHFGCWILAHSAYNEKKWYEKFSVASLVMDLSLQDEKMAAVRLVHEGATTVGVLQAMTIKEHPIRSIELAETLLPLNQDTINLIELHHERFDGTGFPRKRFVNQIPSVTRHFILAMMCADIWIESEDPEQFKKFLTELAENQSLRSLHEVFSKLLASLE